jgi:hypothetical protein
MSERELKTPVFLFFKGGFFSLRFPDLSLEKRGREDFRKNYSINFSARIRA